jgi:hypothetical protein
MSAGEATSQSVKKELVTVDEIAKAFNEEDTVMRRTLNGEPYAVVEASEYNDKLDCEIEQIAVVHCAHQFNRQRKFAYFDPARLPAKTSSTGVEVFEFLYRHSVGFVLRPKIMASQSYAIYHHSSFRVLVALLYCSNTFRPPAAWSCVVCQKPFDAKRVGMIVQYPKEREEDREALKEIKDLADKLRASERLQEKALKKAFEEDQKDKEESELTDLDDDWFWEKGKKSNGKGGSKPSRYAALSMEVEQEKPVVRNRRGGKVTYMHCDRYTPNRPCSSLISVHSSIEDVADLKLSSAIHARCPHLRKSMDLTHSAQCSDVRIRNHCFICCTPDAPEKYIGVDIPDLSCTIIVCPRCYEKREPMAWCPDKQFRPISWASFDFNSFVISMTPPAITIE